MPASAPHDSPRRHARDTAKFRRFEVVQNPEDREAVAPKLLYLDNRIQHAGMVTGTRRLLGTAFHTYPRRTTANMNLAQALSHEPELASGRFARASSSSCGRRGPPRPERFVSEDAERAAGGEMALDVEGVEDSGVKRQEALG